jgi:hypothetical protein
MADEGREIIPNLKLYKKRMQSFTKTQNDRIKKHKHRQKEQQNIDQKINTSTHHLDDARKHTSTYFKYETVFALLL